MKRAVLVAVAAGLLALVLGVRAEVTQPAGQAAQGPPASFRAGVEVVDVDVSVLDKFRQPITGLTAADFTVLEDGKPRPIVAFTPVDLPPRELASVRWIQEVAPDAQTNDLQREGRLVVLLLDRSIAFEDVAAARQVAEATVDQLRPADLAAIVYTEYGVPQNFTADRRRLRSAIQRPSAALPAGDRGDASPCFCGTCTLDRITEVAEALRDVRQRRKILFIIGSNLAVTGRGGCGAAIGNARTRALRAIGAANLTVHVFDPSGVRTLSANAASRTSARRGGLANLQRIGNLRILPDHTGGRAVAGNTPEQALPEIFRESNSYYVLGFNPAHSDGRFHDITVKVAGKKVILQARRGYVAAGAKVRSPAAAPKGIPTSLFAAIAGLWPRTALPLSITATPAAAIGLQAADVNVTISVEDAAGSPRARPVNVVVGAFDRNGQALAYAHGAATAAPRREPAGRVSYDLLSHLELKPGRYEIRAAVEDIDAGVTGSVYSYVDVPNYWTEFLSLSGIFLAADPQEPLALLSGPGPDWLAGMPTPRRDFTPADRVAAWFQIYQGIHRPSMPGYLLAEIRDEHDTRVFHQETRMLATDIGDNRAITERIDLPVEALAPGEYLLNVEMRQGNASTRRDLRFRIK